MARAKNELPREWVKLLHDHSDRVVYLRLLWRRGRRSYLPLVPLEECPSDIYSKSDWKFWEARESQATHFEVKFPSKMNPEARAELIDETLAQLWAKALEWARALGGWCDIALVGYGKRGNVEFQRGKRCGVRLAAPEVPGSVDCGRAVAGEVMATGTIEIVVGKCVFRVWDRDALRMVVDALAAS
jgi:hypothetical protein